ncbi:hypothetical protein KY361_03920 [Candidatus Woesearchaeota archaeon]|nr:hypothetical protein [Candidatus Woesearchaeota archaeon]
MGYRSGNCNVSYHPCSANYAFSGDCNVVAEYFLNSDLPAYTARFYSPTPQEVFSDFRYDRVGLDYSGSKEMVEAVRGLDVDIPRGSMVIEGGGSPGPGALMELPKNEIVEDIKNEIKRAQEEVTGKEMIMRELQVDELILRRIRKRELVVRDKKGKDRKVIDQ